MRDRWRSRAPDAESLRVALRGAGTDYDTLWTGAVSHMPGAADIVLVVERTFERPLSRAQERACRASTARRLAEPVRVLLSRSRQRVVWLCRTSAPDAILAAESALAGHGCEVWSCDADIPRGIRRG